MENQGDGADKVLADLLGAVETSLHADLLIHILVRLPIKSILRFKSVSRAWYNLFSSPIFIKHHSRARMSNLSSLLVHTKRTIGNGHRFNLLLDRSCGNPDWINLDPPFEGDLEHINVVGSIGGLVCLSLNRNATSIVLWNPALRKQSNIPNPKVLLASNEPVSLGFAYDETTQCYKVIRILYCSSVTGRNRPARVEIYSTGTNTWRTTEVAGSHEFVYPTKYGVVANGAPYWLACETGSNFQDHFVWFDASTEAFRSHALPPDVDHQGWFVDMNVIGDHPVVMFYQRKSVPFPMAGKITKVEIRKLNWCDNGGKGSYNVEKLSIEPVPHLSRIVGFWRDVEMIAIDQYSTLLTITYDARFIQVKYLPSHGDQGWPSVYNYTESLVWPSSLA